MASNVHMKPSEAQDRTRNIFYPQKRLAKEDWHDLNPTNGLYTNACFFPKENSTILPFYLPRCWRTLIILC